MITKELIKRALPDVLTLTDGRIVDSQLSWSERREEILELLCSEIYGVSPPPPQKVTAVTEKFNDNAFAGKAVHSLIHIKFDTPKGEFSFPINLIVPKKIANAPLFLHITFRPDIPDIYYPIEEIIDGGFATASFCYSDVASDFDDNFIEGIAGMYRGNRRAPDEWGKISMWAWAAMRVMDYLQTLDTIDKGRIAVIGHSRLGKTALWCAAQDERFVMGISNNSGCLGAAISRGKTGEQVKDVTDRFGYWFCDNYKKYIDNEKDIPFDQHFLIGAIAPRYVYVASATNDTWADPKSEFLGCAAASKVYEALGLKGLVSPDEYPQGGTKLNKGGIAYHLRDGTHFLSRYDWQCFMEYLKGIRV